MIRLYCFLGLLLVARPQFAAEGDSRSHQWPSWRGPLSTGVAPHANPPLDWSETVNVRWKAPLPGLGHSSPVVWGDTVYVTTAMPYGEALEPKPETAPGAHDNSPVTHRHEFVVLAIDRADGKVRWRRTVCKTLPHEGGHYTGSLASQSPVTDGEMVYAHFGSRGLYAFDKSGELKWQKDFGLMQTKHAHGEGSSPALHDDTLIVNWDHEAQSFVVALDKRTGEEKWKIQRPEVTSWASPIIVEHAGQAQVIVSGTHRVRGYDLKTGETIWECGGLSDNVVATPVYADGVVYAASSYDTRAVMAISLKDARGDLTDTDHVLWRRRRGSPYVPSPLWYDGWLYYLSHYHGILSRVEAESGDEPTGPFRLGGLKYIYASPVGAADRVYITDTEGTTAVFSNGEIPRILAVNRLDDRFSATLAIAGDDIFLRGEKHLYCVGKKPEE